jgi:hypothetical protein
VYFVIHNILLTFRVSVTFSVTCNERTERYVSEKYKNIGTLK